MNLKAMILLCEIQHLAVLQQRLGNNLHSTEEALERRDVVVERDSRSDVEVRNTGAPDGSELLVRAASIDVEEAVLAVIGAHGCDVVVEAAREVYALAARATEHTAVAGESRVGAHEDIARSSGIDLGAVRPVAADGRRERCDEGDERKECGGKLHFVR
ncbi:hypothetical protein B0H13DRAFT_2064073 [Mycena leptocephala]|nr:hypothetical protein B0H13DRAFT_2064073 [Mycena leptocephala]